VSEIPEDEQVKRILDMAIRVSRSGVVGRKESKPQAEAEVRQALGPEYEEFETAYGSSYWGWLKAFAAGYLASRGVESEIVVRGYPFNWMNVVDSKCSAVMLRSNYKRGGEHRVEPELFLELGRMDDNDDNCYVGAAIGIHLLYGADGNSSRYVEALRSGPGAEMVDRLRQSKIVGAEYDISWDNELEESWQRDQSDLGDLSLSAKDVADVSLVFLLRMDWNEVGPDFKERAYAALDEVMPLFRLLASL